MSKFSEYQQKVGALNLSQDEVLSRYLSGADELEAAIEGLSEEDLDRTRAPEKWTIRQYVHHVVADDRAASTCIEAAICQPGNKCSLEWYEFKRWAEVVGRANYSVEPAIELMRAQHRYIAGLIECLPDAWDRSVSFLLPGKPSWIELSVGSLVLGWSVCHVRWHLKHIRETRRVCSR